jgi:two-component system NtrC family response regulator/two-component system response regulator HydG
MTTRSERPVDPWSCSLDDFQTADPAMRRCLDLARLAATTNLPVLILGETGTGKTLLARAVHNSSPRADRAFVAFNAAALSDTLLDSQLFGHERGAFTGADRRVKGKFELADGGTLFLDEIADMSPVAQVKILRAVEYGEFERLGSEALHVANVRLISATHWPIGRFVEAERFRRDLFYRISGLTLTLPPLRERPGDLPALITAEIALACKQQHKTVTGLETRAADRLFSHPWPGNLRELSRVVHSAVALSQSDVISTEAIDILLEAGSAPEAAPRASAANGDITLRTAVREHVGLVLARMGGNKRRAARALGLSRSTLDRQLKSATERQTAAEM